MVVFENECKKTNTRSQTQKYLSLGKFTLALLCELRTIRIVQEKRQETFVVIVVGRHEKALMPSVMFAIYIDGIYYANRGVYTNDATTIKCEYCLNEDVLSHYDPNFIKGL